MTIPLKKLKPLCTGTEQSVGGTPEEEFKLGIQM